MSFSSRVLRPETANDPMYRGCGVPVNRSSAFSFERAEDIADAFQGRNPGFKYTRPGNPTVAVLESRMAELCGGVGSICFASGMAAVTAALLSLTKSGDNIVASTSLFGSTFDFLHGVLGKYGVETRHFTPGEEDKVEELIDENTVCVFTETIGNPKMDFPDLEKLGEIAKAKNIPYLVDATTLAPSIFDAKSFGASLILYSTTKSISGQSRAVGGCVIDTGLFDWSTKVPPLFEAFVDQGEMLYLKGLRARYLADMGACMAPDVAELTVMGLETCELRVERHSHNAVALAKALNELDEVKSVNYVGLPNNPFHEMAKKHVPSGLFGGFMAFDLGTQEKAFDAINKLKVAQIMTNLGDVRTLVIHPYSTIYAANTEEDCQLIGVTEGLVRVSVGIEATEHLVADFVQAIKG